MGGLARNHCQSEEKMQRLRYATIALTILFCSLTSAAAEVRIGIGLPNVRIGINLPLYPELVPVPGYPVYYAPQVHANLFFYDGLYWAYYGDNWYASSWYNGPWGYVGPEYVPLFILRIPVRYYRQPPASFRGWKADAPPRWGKHWGRDWEKKRKGWESWQRNAVPERAPLPLYQREYGKERYPGPAEQERVRGGQYRYDPREEVVRDHYRRPPEKRREWEQERNGGRERGRRGD
jgi:hypothetical protein